MKELQEIQNKLDILNFITQSPMQQNETDVKGYVDKVNNITKSCEKLKENLNNLKFIG